MKQKYDSSGNIKILISKMTLEEKASLCSGQDFWNTKEIKRFGIESYMMTDGPHGLRKQATEADHMGLNQSLESTCFPTGASLASTWNRELLKRVGAAIGREAKANDVGIVLGPAVNIKRSPLCGRNFEYYSEDPHLTSELAKSYIEGLQSEGVGSSIKHFAANNQEKNRMVIDTIVDNRTLREIYLAAFETAVRQSKPWTVMCAYNKLNGEYCSENKWLLTEVLRKEWGYEGAVVTDWGACNLRTEGLIAGQDIEMPGNGGSGDKKIIEAVNAGDLDEVYLDIAVERILRLYFKVAENRSETESCDEDAHHKLAREAAQECIILLKNEKSILPLKKQGRIAFIGAFAKEPRYQGAGSSRINPYRMDNSYDSAVKMLGNKAQILYAKGYDKTTDSVDHGLLDEAVQTAKSADTAVIFVGLTEQYESEGFDRIHLRMPENHIQLIEEVSSVQNNLIVVLCNGAPVEMPWISRAGAVLETYLGGQAAGSAVIDVLFGDISPSGKLAETFPARLADNPSYLNFPGEGKSVSYREGIYVGYRYYDSKDIEPLFPFGYGLSYTQFEYMDLKLEKISIKDDETLNVRVDIKNIGDRLGKEIVQLYVKDCESEVSRPEKELKGFEKLSLGAGEKMSVRFSLDKRSFAFWDDEINNWRVESGAFEILVGASSRDIRLSASVEVLSTTVLERIYDRNASVGELLNHPVACKWAENMRNAFLSLNRDSEPGSPEALLTETMSLELPIRNLVMLQIISEDDLSQVILELNGKTELKMLK